MVEIYKSISPLVVAVLTFLATALIAFTAKYTPSHSKSAAGIKRFGARIFYFCWGAWLIYAVMKLIVSPEPPRRLDAFLISIYTVCLGMFVIFFILKDITRVLKHIIDLQTTHQGITDNLIRLQRSVEISAITEKLDNDPNLSNDH